MVCAQTPKSYNGILTLRPVVRAINGHMLRFGSLHVDRDVQCSGRKIARWSKFHLSSALGIAIILPFPTRRQYKVHLYADGFRTQRHCWLPPTTSADNLHINCSLLMHSRILGLVTLVLATLLTVVRAEVVSTYLRRCFIRTRAESCFTVVGNVFWSTRWGVLPQG